MIVMVNKIKGIKGILLDLDGTLYNQLLLRFIMALCLAAICLIKPFEMSRKLKIIVSYRKAQEILRKSNHRKGDNYDQQIQLTCEKTGESLHYVEGAIKEWFENRPLSFLRLCMRRKAQSTLDLWWQKGLTLGVYSDYPVKNKISSMGLSKYFSIMVSGADKDIFGFKPMTNGFNVAARKMGLAPSQILYIGDREDVDGVGASDSGMQVVIIADRRKAGANCQYRFCRSFKDIKSVVDC